MGPDISVVSKPFFDSDFANSNPCFPLDLLVINLTGSIYSFVGPAVTSALIFLFFTWPNKKLLMPWMNLLHFSWGVGATICPLLAAGVGLQANNLPLLYFIIFIIGIIATAPLLFFESPLVDDERQEQNNKDTNVAVNIVDTSIVETTTATNQISLGHIVLPSSRDMTQK